MDVIVVITVATGLAPATPSSARAGRTKDIARLCINEVSQTKCSYGCSLLDEKKITIDERPGWDFYAFDALLHLIDVTSDF